jgi:hypothetical protein
MATKKGDVSNARVKKHVKRKGIHAKTKQSALKSSKVYKKPYRSQGR